MNKNKKMLISVASIILIITITIAITLAFLTDKTTEVVNTFDTPEIETPIEEDFNGIIKNNVTATNSADSDVDVYVRMKFVVQTLEATYDDAGNPIMVDEDGNDVYLVYEEGVLTGYADEDGNPITYNETPTLQYKTGSIVATPDSYDDDGYLSNLPINILNVLSADGLNVDFSGAGEADWFTDAEQETGIYFYKYSLSPGESAYDLVTEIEQELYYEDVVIRLTVLVDSVQVDGVEDSWINVNQSAYLDANGNPILYSSTYTEDNNATGIPPTDDYDTYDQRFQDDGTDTYEDTKGYDSYGNLLTNDTTE